ncbi:MAG TPA: hypothetical protein PLP61_00790, partial [Nocardioides sp.]|uniref:hypothetical protein n=1 Tax=Nocardioides sp. TaxID=35761 RepID=UPI002C4B0223
PATHPAPAAPAAKPRPLRPGERRVTLRMPQAYTPSAPEGVGTDDYRCFLLDPGLRHDAFLTGTAVLPGNSEVVHHVILFRVPPDLLGSAQALDRADPGQGWTCFGDIGFGQGPQLDDAPWLGAWAPGGRESVVDRGFGTRLEAGTRIVMQVHYNLLAGPGPDVSATQLRLAPGDSGLTELHTMLLPAPVELPCRPGHDQSPLCDRDAAVRDVVARFGPQAGQTANLLHLLCQDQPRPGSEQSCVRVLSRPTTIRAVAGHMHLLGRSIRIEVNPGTPTARTVLDIPVWDFDNQGSRSVPPVHLRPFDTVKVTCRHVQWLRDRLPAFDGQPDRYVVWGEGTTDEMCLGILTVTTP